jgi:hypothetical protein
MGYQDKEKDRAWKKQWYAKNRDRIRAAARTRRKENPQAIQEIERRAALKRYGLTPETFEAMVEEQKGRCKVCQVMPQGKGNCGILHVDHDHRTGKVRSLLCMKCNTAMGLMNECPLRMIALCEYMEANGLG